MKTILLAILLIFILSSCNYPYTNEPILYHVNFHRLTLAWDPPANQSQYNPNNVVKYHLYYQRYGKRDWTFLAEVNAGENPEFTVQHDQLGNGLFNFAVSSVNTTNSESYRHSSLDVSADPISGWYVWWLCDE